MALRFDVLVIGSGLAGQSAALRLAQTCKVGLISKRALEDFVQGLAEDEQRVKILGVSPADTATESYKRYYPNTADEAQDHVNDDVGNLQQHKKLGKTHQSSIGTQEVFPTPLGLQLHNSKFSNFTVASCHHRAYS